MTFNEAKANVGKFVRMEGVAKNAKIVSVDDSTQKVTVWRAVSPTESGNVTVDPSVLTAL